MKKRLVVAAVALLLAAPIAPMAPAAPMDHSWSLTFSVEKALDNLVLTVTAALRPERLGQDDQPEDGDGVSSDAGAKLRPERLGGDDERE